MAPQQDFNRLVYLVSGLKGAYSEIRNRFVTLSVTWDLMRGSGIAYKETYKLHLKSLYESAKEASANSTDAAQLRELSDAVKSVYEAALGKQIAPAETEAVIPETKSPEPAQESPSLESSLQD